MCEHYLIFFLFLMYLNQFCPGDKFIDKHTLDTIFACIWFPFNIFKICCFNFFSTSLEKYNLFFNPIDCNICKLKYLSYTCKIYWYSIRCWMNYSKYFFYFQIDTTDSNKDSTCFELNHMNYSFVYIIQSNTSIHDYYITSVL